MVNHFEAGRAANSAALMVDEALCLNLRGRNLSCTACADVCHFNALDLSEDAIVPNDARCTQCGACVPVCPAGALSLSTFSPRDFVEALAGRSEAHIHCGASSGEGDEISVPCHQLLDARLIAAAFAAGTGVFHLHGLAQCVHCESGSAVNHVAAVRSQLAQWFGAETMPQLVMADTQLEGDHQPQLGRRNFLRLVGQQAVASTCSWLVPDEADGMAVSQQGFYQGEIGHQQPDAYQSLLAEQVADLPWQAGALPWYRRSINEACNACLACGQRCPTGALQAHESDAGRSISFATALCTDCGLCAQVCPMDAITRHPVSRAQEVQVPRVVLMNRPHETCRQCRQTFIPQLAGETLCQGCNNEQQMRHDWLAMMQ